VEHKHVLLRIPIRKSHGVMSGDLGNKEFSAVFGSRASNPSMPSSQ
jgi:hypothetical protein